jgi:drug/metabolite transporter (DMT)-like permease
MFAAPLLVTALSGPLLGEWAGPRRWAAVAIGFVGVLLVTRPGVGEAHWAVFLSLGAMLSYTFYIIMTRRLGASESMTTLLVWPGFVGVGLFAPFAVPAFVVPELALLPLVLLLGVLGALGHHVLIAAHKLASPNVLAPFAYTQMVWMVILGYLLFNDLPDVWTLAGSSIIGASGLYILHRERIRAKAARPAEAAR